MKDGPHTPTETDLLDVMAALLAVNRAITVLMMSESDEIKLKVVEQTEKVTERISRMINRLEE